MSRSPVGLRSRKRQRGERERDGVILRGGVGGVAWETEERERDRKGKSGGG
jgi:hypothetical protein